jgi:hypothetical protein
MNLSFEGERISRAVIEGLHGFLKGIERLTRTSLTRVQGHRYHSDIAASLHASLSSPRTAQWRQSRAARKQAAAGC